MRRHSITLFLCFVMGLSFCESQNTKNKIVTEPAWGYKFTLPHGWKIQKDDNISILEHDNISGTIFVMPHDASNIDEVKDQMQSRLEEDEIFLFLESNIQTLKGDIIVGDYAGVQEDVSVKAFVAGTLSKHGGGAYIIAIAEPEQYSQTLKTVTESIAKSMEYFPKKISTNQSKQIKKADLQSNTMMQWISGTYYSFTGAGIATGGTERRLILCPSGDFRFISESGYSGEAGSEGAWGTASQSGDYGRWRIEGNEQRFTIDLSFSNGRSATIIYRADQMEKGCFYMNQIQFCFEAKANCE